MAMVSRGNNFAGIYRDPISNLIGTERTVLINIIIDCKFNDDPDFALRDGTPIPLKRGQLMTSIKRLVEKTGLTPQQIRTAIKRLKKRQIINQVSTKELTKKATLLGLINPDFYLHQNSHSTKSVTKDQQSYNKPSNKAQPSPNKGTTIYKKDKKEENDKNEKKINTNVRFEEFWDLYDYKKAKPKALQSYTKALTVTTHEEIVKGVEAYKKSRGLDKQYWKHPATWLNAQSWGDEYVSKKKSIHDLSDLDYSQGLEGFDSH